MSAAAAAAAAATYISTEEQELDSRKKSSPNPLNTDIIDDPTNKEESLRSKEGGGGGRQEGTDTVVVGPSRIAGAGSGLFAARSFIRGEIICRYSGQLYRTAEAIRLKDKTYLMRLGPQRYVVGSTKARYINDCRHPGHYNVRFDKRPQEGWADVVATTDVEKGDELFANYGRWYWLGSGMKPSVYSAAPRCSTTPSCTSLSTSPSSS